MNSDEEFDDDCPVLVQVQEPAKDAKKVPGHFLTLSGINLLIIVRCFTHFLPGFMPAGGGGLVVGRVGSKQQGPGFDSSCLQNLSVHTKERLCWCVRFK